MENSNRSLIFLTVLLLTIFCVHYFDNFDHICNKMTINILFFIFLEYSFGLILLKLSFCIGHTVRGEKCDQ